MPLLETEPLSAGRFPLVLFPDGTQLEGPGLPTTPNDDLYDVVIVGGLFVAGDVRHGSIKRVASAVGEGATSIALVHSYLAAMDGEKRPG